MSRPITEDGAPAGVARRQEASAGPNACERRQDVLVPFAIWLLSRAYLIFLGFAAPRLLAPLNINRPVLPRSDPLAAAWAWTSPWFRFDAAWYVGVAEHGYHWGSIQHTNTNFYPLYPLLIRTVQPLTLGSGWLGAWLVANLAFLMALYLLWYWAVLIWNRETALRVLLLVVTFPFAFFFATPYAEPVFLALAVAAFVCAEQDRWGLAILFAGLSAITRPVGIAVVASLVLLAFRRGDARHAALAALGFAPFVAFVAYLGVATGHPLGFTVYHTGGWVPPHGGPVTTVGSQFHTKLSPVDRIDVAVGLIFLLSAIGVWRKIGPAYALYVFLGVALPLTRGLAGLERYVIVLFPVQALWATWENKGVQVAIFAVSLLGLTIFTVMFAVGYSLF